MIHLEKEINNRSIFYKFIMEKGFKKIIENISNFIIPIVSLNKNLFSTSYEINEDTFKTFVDTLKINTFSNKNIYFLLNKYFIDNSNSLNLAKINQLSNFGFFDKMNPGNFNSVMKNLKNIIKQLNKQEKKYNIYEVPNIFYFIALKAPDLKIIDQELNALISIFKKISKIEYDSLNFNKNAINSINGDDKTDFLTKINILPKIGKSCNFDDITLANIILNLKKEKVNCFGEHDIITNNNVLRDMFVELYFHNQKYHENNKRITQLKEVVFDKLILLSDNEEKLNQASTILNNWKNNQKENLEQAEFCKKNEEFYSNFIELKNEYITNLFRKIDNIPQHNPNKDDLILDIVKKTINKQQQAEKTSQTVLKIMQNSIKQSKIERF